MTAFRPGCMQCNCRADRPSARGATSSTARATLAQWYRARPLCRCLSVRDQAPRSVPRFQKYDRDALAKLAETATFAPAGSGAGTSGFGSTNTRKSRSKIKTKNAANAQTIAPGVPAQPTPSPYDKSADVTASVPAGAPG